MKLVACIAAAAALAAVPAAHGAGPYNFSPVNQNNVKLTAEFWNPIIEYVSQKSGVHLVLKIGRTSADTTSFVIAQEVDFAYTNHMFSPERERMGWKVFGRRNTPPIRGQILVAADSPVKSLAELSGAEVAFAGSEAFVGYKVPYAELLRLNIPVKVVFGGNHDGAFSQLFSGRVKAAGANSQLAEAYAQREKRAFRVLWSSGEFNELALMASPRVPAQERQAVAKAFTGMHLDPAGAGILLRASELVKAVPPVQYVPATEAEYASYREFYRTAPAMLR